MGRTPRVIVVGAKGVGKTSILEKAISGADSLEKPYIPTVEDIFVGYVETEKGCREKMCFYDSGGLDPQNKLIPQLYHSFADAYVLVYSITDRTSLQLLTDIKRNIEKNKEKKDVPIIVLGNKQDLHKSTIIDRASVESWVQSEKLKHFETSVTKRSTLVEPLVYLATKLFPLSTKSSFPQLQMGRKNRE